MAGLESFRCLLLLLLLLLLTCAAQRTASYKNAAGSTLF